MFKMFKMFKKFASRGFFCEAGFFFFEKDALLRVMMLVERLAGSSLISRIKTNSIKGSDKSTFLRKGFFSVFVKIISVVSVISV